MRLDLPDPMPLSTLLDLASQRLELNIIYDPAELEGQEVSVQSPADIRAASQLPGAEVENALRYLMARDFVELREGRVFMTLHWYRAVTRVLWRRHLIIRSAA